MNLTLGFSPCPNDTFIFYAMIHARVDCEGLEFVPYISDVEDLNRKAFTNEIDITKLSFHAFIYLQENYILLNSGSALGNNCGPLLISKRKINADEIEQCKIAIPGKYTTASLLLKTFFPTATNTTELVFSDIENALLEEKFDAGVIIHENRFTYEKKGLKKIADLGELWETKTKHPIPLGGIVARRNFENELLQKINRVMKRSVEFAFANTEEVMHYVKKYSQEMEEAVMKQHIALYVNNYTIDLGEKGKDAIAVLFNYAKANGIVEEVREDLFVR